MNSADINSSLIDSYFSLLKNLSPNSKLELIARLSKSMKTTTKTKDNSWKSLFGAFVLDQSADEFVEELKKDRKLSRKPIDL
jgi:hypothetical protein